jgi:serine O-acetyltransferase
MGPHRRGTRRAESTRTTGDDTAGPEAATSQAAAPEAAGSLPGAETYRSPGEVPLDGRGPWLAEFREDLARYSAHHDGRTAFSFCVEQGAWALLRYRIACALYRKRLPEPPRAGTMIGLVVSQKLIEILTGISLPFQADLAPGIYIGHFGPTLVHLEATIGTGCNISQGVSIGASGRGDRRGAPVIGRRVYIGANAVVAGKIHVGDESVIAANALVNRDVPPGCTVVGNPATVVSDRGTAGMGLHQRPVTGIL